MRSVDEIITKLAAKWEMTPEQEKMYRMSPTERTQYKREQAEKAVADPVEYMQQKFHTKPQYADLGPKWIEGIAQIILDEPGKFFESKLYKNKTFAKFLNNKSVGRDNFILAAARAVVSQDPLAALNNYKFQNMQLLHRLSWAMYQKLKEAGVDLDDPETEDNLRGLVKVIALTYPDKFLATEELVNDPRYQSLIPAAKRRL